MFRIKQISGSFVKRLANLFFFFGVIPALLLSGLSALFLVRQNNDLVTDLEERLKLQTEIDLVDNVETRALQYDEVFQEKSRVAIQIANYLAGVLEDPRDTDLAYGWDFNEQTYLHPSGWRINQEGAAFGIKMSPLAVLTDAMVTRQNAIATSMPLLRSIQETDSSIRTIFIISADQTGWIYPNRFWDNGEFIVGTNPDFTARSYYQVTEEVVWSNPYIDIEPGVTVITVTAPIWADGEFSGIVGVDFSITTFIEEVLQTEIGSAGFLFLLGEEGEVIALPDESIGWLLPEDVPIDLEGLLNKNLSEVVSEDIQASLLQAVFFENLAHQETFLSDITLEGGDAYVAVAPIGSMRWNVAAVLPVSEVAGFADQLSLLMQQNTSSILLLLLITGVGFFGVILLGALFNLKQLVIPIQTLAQGAEEISVGNLSHRVPENLGFDEVNSLSENFNIMADSIQLMREDIESRRKALQRTLEEKELEFDSINKIAEVANRQISLSDTVRAAVEIIQEALHTESLVVSLVDAENRWTAVMSEDTGDTELSFERLFAQNGFDDLLCACAERGGMYINLQEFSSLEFPEFPYQELISIGGKSLLIEPIFSKGKLLGAFVLLIKSDDPISPQQSSFVGTIIRHLSVLIENVHLQNLSRDLTIIEERRRLASEMHDSVTQSLFTIRLTAEGLKNACFKEDEDQQAMGMLVDQIYFVQKEMRALIQELRPIDNQTDDLFQLLKGRVSSFQRTSGIEADLKVSGNLHQIPPVIRQNINRITQEALSNIIKHAKANHVSVDFSFEQGVAILTITDDGVGFIVEEVLRKEGLSLGLLSMRERAESLGGALLLRSEIGKGTSVIVKIPVVFETKEIQV